MPDFKTFCPRCKQTELGDLRTIPPKEAWAKRCWEGHQWIGATDVCPQDNLDGLAEAIPLIDHLDWHVPSESICTHCLTELAIWASVVAEGGIYFRCANCWVEGVAPPNSPLALYVRERVKPPLEVRAELAYCPKCNPPVRIK